MRRSHQPGTIAKLPPDTPRARHCCSHPAPDRSQRHCRESECMFLPPDPAPRPPGFDDQLARSVELKRQQLERDIADYIERRRQDLRAYEQQLLAQHRSMECSDDKHAHTAAAEEKAKRIKHSRVQKREKELYGLVTPVFLPLLDARDSSPAMEEHSTAVESAREPADAVKKSRRASTPTITATRKSALRTHSSTKPRRKRVSLVIDGHTVLPADTPAEPALTSPSSETTSASNSTASLDDMIDPRLLSNTPEARIQTHTEATHHSLPLPMSNTIHSPTKPLIDNTPLSPPMLQPFITPAPLLPALPSPDPIAAEEEEEEEEEKREEEEAHFDTYVGGLRGSGADDVDQAGSYGYPSSLGASYLETYMQSRPLRVRMEAVEKAGLQGVEKAGMVKGRREEEVVHKVVEEDVEEQRALDGGDEDVDIMGEMEGV